MQPTTPSYVFRETTTAPSGAAPRPRTGRTGPETRPTTQGSSPVAVPSERQPERDGDNRPRRYGRDERRAPAADLPPSMFRSTNGPAVAPRPSSGPAAPARQQDRPATRPAPE